MDHTEVTEIYTYPIKSTRGICLEENEVGPRGLRYDRWWALFDTNNQVITAREFPNLLDVHPKIVGNQLKVKAPHLPPMTFPLISVDQEMVEVQVFKDHTTGIEVSDEANHWFSKLTGIECRLLFMDERCQRDVLPRRGGKPGDVVSYADECPLLLISEASLSDLNERLEDPIVMQRFRPNLVVKGCAPFEEDTWTQIRIGGCSFDVVQQCKRCIFITIDPATKLKHPEQEPLRTLATYRRHPRGGVAFGVHLIPRSYGKVSIGDPITILK